LGRSRGEAAFYTAMNDALDSSGKAKGTLEKLGAWYKKS
jgi:hypothetical protein